MPSLGESIEEGASLPGSKTKQLVGALGDQAVRPQECAAFAIWVPVQILTLEIFALHALIPCPKHLRKCYLMTITEKAEANCRASYLAYQVKF